MDILEQIVARKREIVAQRKKFVPLEELKEQLTLTEPRPLRSMKSALLTSPTGIIAEFKRRSPSKGWLHPDAQVTAIVPAYERAKAAACSILTDEDFFGGKDMDLQEARRAVNLPLLRKDFVIDEYQLYEAKALGADAVLLIAAILEPETCQRFAKLAHQLGLEVLLEIHTLEELRYLLPEVDMLGVNNRNLGTFQTSVSNSMQLIQAIKAYMRKYPEKHSCPVLVSESGINSPAQLHVLKGQGFQGFLIGETFMKEAKPEETLRQFTREATFIYKVCGMKQPENIAEVLESGTNAIGLIFYSLSPRNVNIEDNRLAEMTRQLDCLKFGVFVNMPPERIVALAEHFGLTHIQLHGEEQPSLCRSLKRLTGLQIVKALGIETSKDLEQAKDYQGFVDYLLLDTKCKTRGGSGRCFDWNILENYQVPIPFLLSGGLSVDSIETLLRFKHPYWAGIDLNSGVERFPGIKDPTLIQQIISALSK